MLETLFVLIFKSPETILRVRNSYGPDVGDNGYINYKRDSGNLVSCRFFDNGYALTVEYRRVSLQSLLKCNGLQMY